MQIKHNMIQTDQPLKYSSGDLRKYEYLTGEDLGYKPSVVEETKFGYSPLRKVLNMGLIEDDQQKGLLKRVKHIGDKNEELLKAFSPANNVSKAFKNESGFNNDSKYAF